MTLKGIDISSWQAGINLGVVPGDFVIVKATGGTSYVNPACNDQVASTRIAGKRLGLYHFAHEVGCEGSSISEADHFVDSIQGYLNGDVILVLDFEGDNQFDSQWALEWLNRVFERTGVKPVIYLNGNALAGAYWSSVWAGDYGLWLAWYAVSSPTLGYKYFDGREVDDVDLPDVRLGGANVVMWQFSSTARLDGWNGGLDVNIFYGDGNTWDAYCRPVGSGVTPTPAPPVDIPVPTPAPKPSGVGADQCVVEAGDSLSSIGAQFGVTWQDLAAANNIVAPYVIHPGQVLNLTGKSTSPVKECVVESGDTLSIIGSQFGVSWQEIARINKISAPYTIYPGQVLTLP